jgi:hypothetical protein
MFDEHVTSMQAAEQSYESVQSLFSFLVGCTLKASSKLVIRVCSDINGCLGLCIHKVLK